MNLWKVTLNEHRSWHDMDGDGTYWALVSLNIVAADGLEAFARAKSLREGQRFTEAKGHNYYWPKVWRLWGLEIVAIVDGTEPKP